MDLHCTICGRCFRSKKALKQHQRDSPVHARPFYCETCDRSFGSQDALEQHQLYSRLHQQDTETPLDTFFRSFSTFDYDPFLPPAVSYANLQRHERWLRGQTESKEAWDNYQNALRSELDMWYGAEDDLTSWHALCRAIGIMPLPKTCAQCEQVKHYVQMASKFRLTL